MFNPGLKGTADWWATVLDRLAAQLPGAELKPAAATDDLTGLETRLGRPFSASYRAFLQTTNGFPSVGKSTGSFLSTAEADWFPKRHPEAAAQIEQQLKQDGVNRRPYTDPKWTIDIPLHAIEITEPLNGATLLLHPRRGRGGGEWDAWLYRPNSAARFPTLADFIEYELRS